MTISQQSNLSKKTKPISRPARLIAAAVLIVIAAGFYFLWASAHGDINHSEILGICGFKQQYQLPCPGCGITTSAMEFVTGHVLKSFYIQPAGAILCITALLTACFSFFVAVFGMDFGVFERFNLSKFLKYLVISAIIVFGGGWAVTLSREFVNH